MSLQSALPEGVRRAWPALRWGVGSLVLGVLLWRFGTGPFAASFRVTTWWTIGAVQVLIALSTVANAWRWRVIARALGVPLTTMGSLTAYYRSQFLNVVLPGGVVGDAHRGVSHGREAGDLGAGLRATVWDRTTGQLVQSAMLVAALALAPSDLRGLAPVALVALTAVVLLGWRLGRRGGRLGFVRADLRLLLRRRVAGPVALASFLSVAAHVAVVLVAVATVGVHASVLLLVAIALTILVGSALPLNIAGWGPREGVTAAVFAIAGLGPEHGLTVSVVLGVVGALATWPGALVLIGGAVLRRRRPVAEAPAAELVEARHG